MPSTLAPAGERRDCQHKHARHEHGTVGAYVNDHCRCLDCRAAHTARARQRRRMIAYGTWQTPAVDNTGSRRRIQALACNGWSIGVIAEKVGCSPRAIDRLFETDCHLVSREKADRLKAIYDELWDQQAPQHTRGEKISARQVLNLARDRNYSPPLAWDDDSIDDPTAEPATGHTDDDAMVDEVAITEALAGRSVALSRAERAELVRLATERKMSAQRIAELSGRTARTVNRARAKVAA